MTDPAALRRRVSSAIALELVRRKPQASSRKLDKGPIPCYSVLQNKGESMQVKEAINILNHVVEYYDMNYDTGKEESTTEEINNAWSALEVLINESKRSN